MAAAWPLWAHAARELLDAPDGEMIEELSIGNSLSIDGRSEDGAWLAAMSNTGNSGWVDATRVVAFNVDQLPVVEADAAEEAMAATTAEPEEEASPDEGASEDATTAPDGEATDAPADSATTEPDEEATEEATEEASEEATAAASSQPTPRPTPQLEEGEVAGTVVLTGTRLNVRSGPGTAFNIVTKAYPDEEFKVIGRNGPATWVEIELPDEGIDSGWVAVDFLRLTDPVADLPISSDDVDVETQATPPPPTSQDDSEATPAPSEEATPQPAEEPAAPSAQAQPLRTVSTGPTGLSGTLAFQTKVSGDIYLYDFDTGDLRFLTKGYEPDISRDGSKVVFTRYGGQAGIWSINADGANERALFSERSVITSPKWSPDGEWIVFSRRGGSYKCYDFGFGICVTESQVCPAEFPQCLDNDLRVERDNFALARVNADGEEYRDLAVLDSARSPDWNEAGIVYDSAATIEITQDEPTGETRQILAERWTDDADWAPNGGLIAFHARQGPHWEIFTIPPEGGETPYALTRPVTTLVDQLPSNVAPTWSPDGQHIAYLSSRDENENLGPWRIWVMDANGDNKRPLPIDIPIEFGFGHEQVLSWGR